MATAKNTNDSTVISPFREARESAALESVQLTEPDVADSNVKARKSNKTYKAKSFDPNQYVTVRNGFQGRLVYTSRKTGERYIWDHFGEEQDMEISELKSARNAHKKFFVENWFMFDDPAVVEYLGLNQYYKDALRIEEFEHLFDFPISDMKAKVSKLSNGQKKSVIYLAKKRIDDGTIDSRQKIAALEEVLGTDLIEQ